MAGFLGYVLLDDTLVGSLLVESTGRVPINADALPLLRIYGPNGFVTDGACTLKDTGTVSNATNAAPIAITSSNHGLTTGTRITVAGVLGNTAANGTFTITRVDGNTFTLDGSSGAGPYVSGGSWNVTGLYHFEITALGTLGFEAGACYQILAFYDVAATSMGQLLAFNVD